MLAYQAGEKVNKLKRSNRPRASELTAILAASARTAQARAG